MRNLITAQEVIDLAFAENSNMMAESIPETAIRIAEIKYIRPAFGAMYPLLADKYADYTNDYVKPALAYFVKCEIVSSIAIDMSNSGVAVANPQYQSAATDKQRQRLYDSEMSKAKTLLDFALEYIATHSEEFPDFSGEAPKKHHRVGGILLGGGTSRNQPASIAGEAFKNEIERLSKDVAGKVDKVEGKGLSTNDFTNEYKQKVDEFSGGGGGSITIDKELSPTSDNAIANSAVTKAINAMPTKEGYYPDMSVGMADNLVGRGDVQYAHINFRPSAGADNITDGAARIEKIKGNSVVWNQRLSTPYTIDYTATNGNTFMYYYATNLESYTYADGVATGVGKPNLSSGLSIASRVDVGHKMLTIAKIKCSVADLLIAKASTSANDYTGSYISTDWNEYAVIVDAPSGDWRAGMTVVVAGEKQNSHDGYTCEIKDIQQIDLTKMFGAGNEPTSYEEYLLRKPMNIEDEFAYNEGTLVDMHADKLVSTGDNAYDYTKGYARVMGGYKYDITANAGATLVVSFYADGEDGNEEREIAPDGEGKYTFPANGICYVNSDNVIISDVCVCLNHSYDKPHPAYQQVVKDLSFIGEAFPEGMRSAGSVFDEIRFNPTKKVWEKVERVGVRAYAEGDAEDSSVTTDGKTTNYPLDNPTPTTIDLSPNFNLDYLVWDFGTEEAIVPNNVPSAPFRADINYEPNAVDDLRWAVAEIRNLKAQIAQMQASVTNLTE